MIHIKNTTEKDITLGYNGAAYLFPAGKTIAVDDERAADHFVNKVYVSPRVHQGKKFDAQFPLKPEFVLDGSDDAPAVHGVIRFHAPPPPPDPELEKKRAAYSLHGKPRPVGTPMPVDPATEAITEKARIAKLDGDFLSKQGRAFGVWKKGMEKQYLVDALYEKGFRAPAG